MLTGTNLTYTKEFNLRIVHETIRVFGPISRAEIARRTELTVQTVSNLVKELLSKNWILEADRVQSGRGAPSVTLALNPEGAFAIGLDLDRDHLTGVLLDLSGTVRQRVHFDLDFPGPEEALDLIERAANEMLARQGLARELVHGVGIGIPGPMYIDEETGMYVVTPKAFPGWNSVPLAEWACNRLGLPVILENNATAAAMGERWFGAGQQLNSFFYFYFGSGLGGGLILNGEPYEGFSGNAGEIGYLPSFWPADGRLNGDRPHVGLHFYLPQLLASLRDDGLHVGALEDLEELYDGRHPLVMAWIEDAAEHLTGLVLAVEYLMDPQAVFFGGRLPDPMLADFMQRVVDRLPQRRVPDTVRGPRYQLARAGADAAALGVATLPIHDLFAPGLQVLLKHADGVAGPGMRTSRAMAMR
jgi:predicted NBD/HSP70 family sugar kinase